MRVLWPRPMRRLVTLAGLIWPMVLAPAGWASTVQDSQAVLEQAHSDGARAQQTIDRLDEQTRENSEHYATTLRQARLAEAYNQQLARMVDDQTRELADLESQLASLAETEQATLPLLVRMQAMLGQFVENDVPFLSEEREQRVARLARLLDRADVSLAEKYRQILEAYQIEAEYGRTLEAWSGSLVQNGETREVTFLRLGRVALYYQTLDGQESGRWSSARSQWESLATEHRNAVREGIRMARQQTVPTLLDLPVGLLGEAS